MMNSPEPNYRMYSLDQLKDALDNIDREKFPNRVATIEKYIESPGPRGNIVKDKRVEVSEKTNALLSYFSLELMFWFIVIFCGFIGFWLW